MCVLWKYKKGTPNKRNWIKERFFCADGSLRVMKQPSVYYFSLLPSFAFALDSFPFVSFRRFIFTNILLFLSFNFFVQFSMSNLIPPTLILFYSLFTIILFFFLSLNPSIARSVRNRLILPLGCRLDDTSI